MNQHVNDDLEKNQEWSSSDKLSLTHWGRDKMATFFQTTFSTELRHVNFQYNFTEVCFQRLN